MDTTNTKADTSNTNPTVITNKETIAMTNASTNVPATETPAPKASAAKPKNGSSKPKTPPAPPPVEVPPGFVAGKVQRVEPSGTSSVPAGDYVIYAARNAAGKEVKRILVDGKVVVVKRLGGRLVACKDIEKTGAHVGVSAKRRGEAGVKLDLSGLQTALAAFQLAGGNAQEEVANLAAGFAVEAAKLEAQREQVAKFQTLLNEKVRRAIANGEDINALLARVEASATQATSEPEQTQTDA